MRCITNATPVSNRTMEAKSGTRNQNTKQNPLGPLAEGGLPWTCHPPKKVSSKNLAYRAAPVRVKPNEELVCPRHSATRENAVTRYANLRIVSQPGSFLPCQLVLHGLLKWFTIDLTHRVRSPSALWLARALPSTWLQNAGKRTSFMSHSSRCKKVEDYLRRWLQYVTKICTPECVASKTIKNIFKNLIAQIGHRLTETADEQSLYQTRFWWLLSLPGSWASDGNTMSRWMEA